MTRRRVLDDGQSAEVARRYVAGETIDELAAAFGVSIQPIRRVIVEAGVPFRRRSHRAPEVDVDDAARRYVEGATLAEIAAEAGVGRTMLRRRLVAAGVQIRPTGRRRRA